MDVCREAMDGLSLLKRSSLTGDQMRAVLSDCRHVLLNEDITGETSDEDRKKSAVDVDDNSHQCIDHKVLRLSICALILELTKHNSSADAMASALEDYGLKTTSGDSGSAGGDGFDANCRLLIDFYRTVRPLVRDVLLSTDSFAAGLPRVVDIAWDQMLVMETSDDAEADDKDKKASEIEYLINISCDRSVRSTAAADGLQTSAGTNDLLMSASLPQLQDLCHKLRECRRVVEKIVK